MHSKGCATTGGSGSVEKLVASAGGAPGNEVPRRGTAGHGNCSGDGPETPWNGGCSYPGCEAVLRRRSSGSTDERDNTDMKRTFVQFFAAIVVGGVGGCAHGDLPPAQMAQ